MTASDRQLSESELFALQADPIAMLGYVLEQSALPNAEAEAVVQLAERLWAELQAQEPEAIAQAQLSSPTTD